jgi:hypothetical protein
VGEERSGGGRKPRELDCMLGSLQADMSRQGVNTTQKGCCGACDKPIVGQVITALAQTWHPEHFVCAHCNQELGTRNFFERDGKPYCEPDYHNLFSPRCAYCNGPILDVSIPILPYLSSFAFQLPFLETLIRLMLSSISYLQRVKRWIDCLTNN